MTLSPTKDATSQLIFPAHPERLNVCVQWRGSDASVMSLEINPREAFTTAGVNFARTCVVLTVEFVNTNLRLANSGRLFPKDFVCRRPIRARYHIFDHFSHHTRAHFSELYFIGSIDYKPLSDWCLSMCNQDSCWINQIAMNIQAHKYRFMFTFPNSSTV